ncbi:hypothetical protein Q7C_1568 [Methylophaga frappieri]|uniref:Uncharacterized protein n=1 Tax=Methylophaga frappieri (strain ATCC BAA-2434 / DSM 25690 / JAM7) TaxID=754477 RepID=I1YIH4_METFJ|nr:hypothetical protein Q7C_1568 [Methylophaga frappieri]
MLHFSGRGQPVRSDAALRDSFFAASQLNDEHGIFLRGIKE